MAVTLTSSGIQYPDGTEQTVSGKYSLIGQTYVNAGSGTVNTYTYTGISQSARRILFMIWGITYNTGPQSPIVKVTNSQGADGTVVLGASLYNNNMSTGQGGVVTPAVTYASGTGTNLFYGATYNTFNMLWLEVILIPDNTTLRKYNYKMWTSGLPSSGLYCHQIDGMVTTGVAPITSLTLSTGSSAIYSGITATLWQA